jgi:hypothetical protein
MKRTLLLGSAWTASAAAAVGLGFLAISLVDASASPGGKTVAASLTTSADASPSSSAPTDSPAAAAGQQVTAGGTVYGSCDGGVPVLASAPAAGWWLDDSSDPGKVEFENGSLKIEVRVTCVAGAAQFSVEGPRGNDSSGNGAGTSTPSATTGSDDSDGRVGGGHGADDGASPGATTHASGDDSDGRVGGGQGADDAATPAATTQSSGDDSGKGAGDDSSGRNGGGHGSDD